MSKMRILTDRGGNRIERALMGAILPALQKGLSVTYTNHLLPITAELERKLLILYKI